MASTSTGVRDTTDLTSSRLKVDMAEKVFLLEPDEHPYTRIISAGVEQGKSSGLPKKPTTEATFHWHEDELLPEWDRINASGGYTAGAVALTVDNGAYFRAHDVLQFPESAGVNQELVKVTSVSGNVLTVQRGYGESSAAALSDNDRVLRIGNAAAEGATLGTLKATVAVDNSNYCQIFRTPFGVTNTLNASETYDQNDLDLQRKKKLMLHLREKESSLLFGELKLDTSGTEPRRMTRGLNKRIATNRTTVAADLTNTEFENFLATGMELGSLSKVLFASAKLVQVINSYSIGKLQTKVAGYLYGVKIYQYVSAFGTVLIVYHRALRNSYEGYGFLVDVEALRWRYMRGRDTQLLTGREANDEDSSKEEFLTEGGVEVHNEKFHAEIDTVTT